MARGCLSCKWHNKMTKECDRELQCVTSDFPNYEMFEDKKQELPEILKTALEKIDDINQTQEKEPKTWEQLMYEEAITKENIKGPAKEHVNTVTIKFNSCSKGIIFENVKQAYEKGSFYCMYIDGKVKKIPINKIWQIEE